MQEPVQSGELHSIGASVNEELLEAEADVADDAIDSDERVARATTLLGEPTAVFKASPSRVRTKLILGSGLIVYGFAATFGWLVWLGPRNFGHFHVHLILWPAIIGGTLLWHLWRHRGLRVLIYPTGLLRIQRGEIDSFPWDEITALKMKLQPQGEPQFRRDDNGELTEAWIETGAPTFQVWSVWLELTRLDGTSIKLSAVLADFPELAVLVQRKSFPHLWSAVQAKLAIGANVELADKFEFNDRELRQGKVSIRWDEMKYLKLTGKLLSAKKKGNWFKTGMARDTTGLVNLHVLMAYAAEQGVMEETEEGDDE